MEDAIRSGWKGKICPHDEDVVKVDVDGERDALVMACLRCDRRDACDAAPSSPGGFDNGRR